MNSEEWLANHSFFVPPAGMKVAAKLKVSLVDINLVR
jgi:hypothetical protein